MGSIMPQAGIAALFGSATILELRDRGVQTALINRRLGKRHKRVGNMRWSVRFLEAARRVIWNAVVFGLHTRKS